MVYGSDNDSEVDIVLKGVVRSERLDDADMYIDELIKRANRESLCSLYGIGAFESPDDFLR